MNGSIPRELDSLLNLRFLELADSELTGEIPPELGDLTNLETLKLGGNRLHGNIPPTLGKLASIEALELNNNQLDDGIPTESGHLSSLRNLVLLEDNELTGCVPTAWQPRTLETLSTQATSVEDGTHATSSVQVATSAGKLPGPGFGAADSQVWGLLQLPNLILVGVAIVPWS